MEILQSLEFMNLAIWSVLNSSKLTYLQQESLGARESPFWSQDAPGASRLLALNPGVNPALAWSCQGFTLTAAWQESHGNLAWKGCPGATRND